MIQPDYERKKRECWEEFCKDNGIDQEVNISIFDAFNQIFDRAYALGIEKETITQEEIEKAAEEYAVQKTEQYIPESYGDMRHRRIAERFDSHDMGQAFEDGVNFALCKHEKDAESSSLWERLTDDEKREMQCRYHTNECVLRDHKKRTGDKAQSKAVARMKLLESLFGKENLKVEKK